jgi:hypothetical protein
MVTSAPARQTTTAKGVVSVALLSLLLDLRAILIIGPHGGPVI